MNKKIIDSLNYRYATKKFDNTKKISDENFNVIFESMRLCPSSFGIQPWKFIVVKNDKLKKKLTPYSRGQQQVEQSNCQIIFCARNNIEEKDIDNFIREISFDTGEDFNDIKRKRIEVGKFDRIFKYFGKTSKIDHECFIALGFLLETCAMLGIDACPMGGIDTKGYDEVLGLENSGYHTVVACPIGYRASDDKYQKKPKTRYSKEKVFDII